MQKSHITFSLDDKEITARGFSSLIHNILLIQNTKIKEMGEIVDVRDISEDEDKINIEITYAS